MGDQTKGQEAKAETKAEKPAIDFGAIFGGTTTDSRLNAPAVKTTEQQVPQEKALAQDRPLAQDRTVAQLREVGPEIKIVNRALVLSMSDVDFDKKLTFAGNNKGQEFDKLKITDVPPGVKVNYWQDPKGLFVWFEGGPDGNKRHHLPGNLNTIELPQQSKTVEAIRLDVNRNYAAQTFSGLQTFDSRFNPSYDGGASSLQYFSKMATLGDSALLKQETVLREAAKTSDNPYYKIYLADVLTASAIKPVINDFLRTGTADLNNPVTLRKLDEAISVLDAAYRDSNGKLKEVNHYPRANAYSPMMPGAPYWNANRYPGEYYGFWAGSYDQAMARQASLKMIRDHIKQNSFPRFELPPELPPKRF
jgi:hypothetical protein